jgi:citrate synthase
MCHQVHLCPVIFKEKVASFICRASLNFKQQAIKLKVESREDPFEDKTKTAIWKEIPDKENEYVANQAKCYGYFLVHLVEKGYGQSDINYLMLKGELPNEHQRALWDALAVALSSPGPRHPATRSVMEAGVSKTQSTHYLPIGLMILGGEKAAGSVEPIMRFMRKNKGKEVTEFTHGLIEQYLGVENDLEIAPGFGPQFEQREEYPINIARSIQLKFKDAELLFLNWALKVDEAVKDAGCGLKMPGLASAILLDLGFHPRMGCGIYQMLSAPGLLAHGLEMMNKPLSYMPFVKDENYHHVGEGDEVG